MIRLESVERYNVEVHTKDGSHFIFEDVTIDHVSSEQIIMKSHNKFSVFMREEILFYSAFRVK